jgi:hypothetical protein
MCVEPYVCRTLCVSEPSMYVTLCVAEPYICRTTMCVEPFYVCDLMCVKNFVFVSLYYNYRNNWYIIGCCCDLVSIYSKGSDYIFVQI